MGWAWDSSDKFKYIGDRSQETVDRRKTLETIYLRIKGKAIAGLYARQNLQTPVS
jgi:hypothetical protein